MSADATRLPLVGAQLSTAGGFAPVPQRAGHIGAEAVQIFNTNPRTWRTRIPSPEEVEALRTGLRRRRLRLFFHSIYLINLASPEVGMRSRAVEALAFALTGGAVAGAEAVVTHIGSHRGDGPVEAQARVVDSIGRAFELARCSVDAPALPTLLLETAAGAGNTLGGRLEELAALLSLGDAAGSLGARLGICLDTAHLFAAGYAVHQESGLVELVADLRALGILERIGLVHLNDSRTPLGSKRDYHENLGQGLIGYEGLARVVRHPAFVHLPFVLEVPGADGHGPDAANIKLAKRMRAGLGPPAKRHR
jgi:deoxyribonuclease IV